MGNAGRLVIIGSGWHTSASWGALVLGLQLAAGAAGTIVTDKVLPKVTAEQVSEELYYKQEVLK